MVSRLACQWPGSYKEGFLLPGSDLLLPHWVGGKDVVTVAGEADIPGHALTVALDRKVRSTAEDCRRQGLALESLGAPGCHGGGKEALARHTGQLEAIQHLLQRLAVLLVKGNCSLIFKRVRCFPDTEIDGVKKIFL